MNKILLLFLVVFPFLGMGQSFVLQDSVEINLPDSYTFYQADIFNSLYFTSKEDNTLLKFNPDNQQWYTLKFFTSSKKLFIVNPLFLVVLDKINKTLEFYDDKLISTQDNVQILANQIINPNLIYIQDNKRLTYFDEFTTESFIQYDYRVHKRFLFSNSAPKDILSNYSYKEIYIAKQDKLLLLKKSDETNSGKEYRIIYQNASGTNISYDISQMREYFWNEKNFFWIMDDILYLYNFEDEPTKVKLPQKGENYFILNQQLFLWKSKVMYLYKLEMDN